MSSELERVEIPIGSLTFDALAAGPPDGRLVLLLHGFPQTSWSWRDQLSALGDAGYRAIAPDQRGYSPGARPSELAAYAREHVVADVLAFADHFKAHQFDLVGHDWGGAVAWFVAAMHPARLRSLTVLSTPHPYAFASALGDEVSDQSQRSGYMAFFRQEGAAETAMLGADGSGDGLRNLFKGSGLPGGAEAAEPYVSVLVQPGALTAALNWYRAMDIGSPPGSLGEVTTPTLYIWSTNDVALGRDAAERTAAFVSGPYRFEVLDGVSHWISEESPDEVNRLLLEHLTATGQP